jgi:lysophospholipase L1-like esterase
MTAELSKHHPIAELRLWDEKFVFTLPVLLHRYIVITMTIHRILGFGASSMQGVGDTQGGFMKRLQTALDGTQVVNLGIGGNTTRDMLKRVAAVEPYKPYYSIVLLGCNDMPRTNDHNAAHRTGLAEYRENLRTLFAKIRSDQNILVTSFFPDESKVGISLKTFSAYMTTAQEVAAGYEVWDLFTESLPLVKQYWAADGLHFNDAGHVYLCRELMRKLEPGLTD